MEKQLDRGYWESRLREVEQAYEFQQGYKLLYCPWNTIGYAKIAFVSQNPGVPPDGAELRVVSDERGNSFEVERDVTRSPLTKQFMAMCEFLGVEPRDVLTGVAAPFRSDRWKSLTTMQRHIGLLLGGEFWRDALGVAPLNLIVCVSNEAATTVISATDARWERSIPAGWGAIQLHMHSGAQGTRVVHLPHLSRFRLFGRAESEAALREALL